MPIKTTNLYYFYAISEMGGIETFFYQLVKKYKDIDLTIVYRVANDKQLARLKEYARCIRYEEGMTFKCTRAFFNFNTDIIDNVEADDYCLVIHGDYETMVKQGQIFAAPGHKKITKYIAVSERACKGYTALTGKKVELCYNPFVYEKPRKVLNLISATRLTREKGRGRMVQLAQALDKANIPYLWTIFTNDTNAIDSPNVIYMKPRLDIRDYIANADYLVQLSDNEGYCYSVVEALSAGVPVIVTPCPVFKELGLEDGKNCYFLPFDIEYPPVHKIYNEIPKFTYTPPKDRWNELLIPSKSTWLEERDTIYTVSATSAYEQNKISDAQLHRIPKKGEQWDVDYDRMMFLTGNNHKKLKLVEVVKTSKKK